MVKYTIREMADRLVIVRSACDPTKNQFMWDALTRLADELKQINDQSYSSARHVAKFLEKIGGDGYGGMSEYEIALDAAREIAFSYSSGDRK